MEIMLQNSWKPLNPLALYTYFDQFPKNITNSTYFDNYDIRQKDEVENYSANFYLTTSLIFIFYILSSKNKNEFFEKLASKKFEKGLNLRLIQNQIIYFVLSIFFLPFLVLISLIFTLYRIIISIVLKIQYGRDFCGLFSGQETVWALEDKSKSIITVKILLESQENENDIYKKITEKMKILCKKYKKLTYVRNKQYGYFFWREKTVEFNNFIKIFDLNEKNLDEFLQKCCNSDMPMENQGTWEILIGKSQFSDEKSKRNENSQIFSDNTKLVLDEFIIQKMENLSKNSKSIPLDNVSPKRTKLIPIIFKIHHSIGDGISLISFLLKNLSDKTDFSQNLPKTKTKSFKKILEIIFAYFYLWFFAAGFAIYQFLTRKKDENILHGPQLSGEKVISSIPDEGNLIFDCVKRSKRILGYSFTEIMLGAISEAFQQHFQNRNVDIPEYMTVVVPIYMGENVPNDLENNFSLGMVNLPIKVNGGFLERLYQIRLETEYLRHAPDYKLNYMMCKVASKYFPADLIQHCLEKQSSTCSISNVPGPIEEITILDGCAIKDIVFWLPNKGHTGLGISILGYNNKLRLGLLVDKILIKDNNEAQKILKNIVNAIHKIDNLCTASTAHK